jgi:hypothetical protein
MQILLTISNLLEHLSHALLGVSGTEYADHRQQVSVAVATMVDFVTLPLLAIFPSAPLEDKSCWDITTDEPERIEQSAIWKCIEGGQVDVFK